MGSEKHIPPHSSRAFGIQTRSPVPEKLSCHSLSEGHHHLVSDTILLQPDSSNTRIDRLQSVVINTKEKKNKQQNKPISITETFFSIYRKLLSVHDFE